MATAKQGSKSGGGKSGGGKSGGSKSGGTGGTGGRKQGAANAAFMKPLSPSSELAAVVGKDPLPRTEVTKRVWEYVKKNDLQDPQNRRNIRADAKLRPVFGKDEVNMFEMTKLVNQHLK
jgi:chromatin remodeling complex protein RSC6